MWENRNNSSLLYIYIYIYNQSNRTAITNGSNNKHKPSPSPVAVRLFPLGCSSARSRQGRWRLPVSRADAMVPPRLQGALRSELGATQLRCPGIPGKDGTKAAQTPFLELVLGWNGSGWSGRDEHKSRVADEMYPDESPRSNRASTATV